MSKENPYTGVSFDNLRKALHIIFFGVKGSDDFSPHNYRYIIPLNQSWENPLNAPDAKNTYIQFWIERDEELTQDDFTYSEDGFVGYSRQKRVASVLLRFVGRQAEAWAKSCYHLCKRSDIGAVWSGVCNAERLLYTAPCIPHKVQFFGKNTSIAFDVRFKLYYDEVIALGWKPLEGINFQIEGKIHNKENKE